MSRGCMRGPTEPNRWASRPRAADPLGITGTVTLSSGSVVSGAIVDLFYDDSKQYISSTTTDASGVYTFSPLNNGTLYRVNVKHPTLSLYGEAGAIPAV